MKDFILDLWKDDITGRLILAVSVLLSVSLLAGIYAEVLEAREWEKFKANNDCEVVARERGHTSTGVGYGMTTSGQMGTVITTSSTPDKTAWLCSDGVTYLR